jgi:multisubunit Na+/H+ antiporter MnhG subunit
MSDFLADIIIWVLLFIGTVFAGLGLMGLLIFPDTRSRMFTAFRATAIGLGAVALAVVTYGYTLFITTGSEQYPALILRTLILVFVLAVGIWVMYGIIQERTHKERPGITVQSPAVSDQNAKDDE